MKISRIVILSLMCIQAMSYNICPIKYDLKGQNTCIVGHDISHHGGVSRESCEMRCNSIDRCLQYDYNPGSRDCWLGNAIGPINRNCGGWQSYEKQSKNFDCMGVKNEIEKEMSDIKAVMKFLSGKINDTETKDERNYYQEQMMELTQKLNKVIKKMQKFQSITKNEDSIEESIIKLEKLALESYERGESLSGIAAAMMSFIIISMVAFIFYTCIPKREMRSSQINHAGPTEVIEVNSYGYDSRTASGKQQYGEAVYYNNFELGTYQLPSHLKEEKDKRGNKMILLDDQVLRDLFSTQPGNKVDLYDGFHQQYWLKHTEPGKANGWGAVQGSERIVLRSHFHKWLCADHDKLIANRTAIGPWEKFIPIPQGKGVVALLSEFGKYMVAENSGKAQVNRQQALAWEHFYVYLCVGEGNGNAGKQCLAFKSFSHNKFLVVESDGTVNCNRTQCGTQEKFYGWN